MSVRLCFCVAAGVTALASFGCAQARYVRLDATGGVVAIPTNTNVWPCYFRNSAEALMKQKCPEGYVIDHEEETSIGSEVTGRTASDTSSVSAYLLGAQIHTTESRDLTEWRITFHSKNEIRQEPVRPVGCGTLQWPGILPGSGNGEARLVPAGEHPPPTFS